MPDWLVITTLQEAVTPGRPAELENAVDEGKVRRLVDVITFDVDDAVAVEEQGLAGHGGSDIGSGPRMRAGGANGEASAVPPRGARCSLSCRLPFLPV